MDAKLVFWTAALINLGVMVGCTVVGVRRIRAKDVRGHRRMMLTAASLVVAFLVAYVIKVQVLGHQDRTRWTSLDYGILYVHETGVALMLLAGSVALYRAWRFRGRLGRSLQLPPESDPLEGRQMHRRAGRIAVAGGVLAFVTAIGVLGGMYARAAG